MPVSRCKAEVLAPAGNRESLEAAVRCGADAVYLGGPFLNARRAADNFDAASLDDAVRYCHERGVLVYLTLNTLVFDREFPALDQALAGACAAGIDAVIVQDLAVAALVRERAPTLPLHASTQMSVHDAAGVGMLEELGFSRVVLARELTREELLAIRAATSMELELFVHGALCMCVSGQCYLSSMIGGRSGNRGLCAQPCRLPFAAGGNNHALSLKDLSLLDSARELSDLGVRSLKIEGRMKRPEYVAAAVTACRQALEGKPPDHAALEAVFSRSGFTRGYYDNRMGREMFGIRRREDVQSAAPVLSGLAGLYKDERPSVPVDFSFTLTRNRPAGLAVCDRDGHRAEITGAVPQEARTTPTDEGRVAAALSKTGGTPYTAGNIQSKIDEGLMLPAAELNRMRREALAALADQRSAPRSHIYAAGPIALPAAHTPLDSPWLRARLARGQQLTGHLAEQVDEIAVPAEEFSRLDTDLVRGHSHKLLVEIPSVAFDNSSKMDEILQTVKNLGVVGGLCGGLGGIAIARRHGLAVHGDCTLNVVNTLSLGEYESMGLTDLTVSFELELARLRRLGGALPRGLIVYGHLPLMTARNCPVGDCRRCGRGFPTVTDRLGNHFFVDCQWQVPKLYNCVPLDLSDKGKDLGCADFLTLYFTRESPEECAEIARQYRQGVPRPGQRTRGLYYRKVK